MAANQSASLESTPEQAQKQPCDPDVVLLMGTAWVPTPPRGLSLSACCVQRVGWRTGWRPAAPGPVPKGEDCPALKVWVPPGSSTVLDSAERVMPWDALDSGFAPHLL